MDSYMQAKVQETLARFNHGQGDLMGSPPEDYKHITIHKYARMFGCDTLVETGTLHGETVAALKNSFRDVYSIEIGPELYRGCVARFVNDPNVHILYGDGGVVLKELIPTLDDRKIIFYLDDHLRFDPTTPEGLGTTTSVPQEVETIAALRPDSVVIIDDGRMFNPQFSGAWPKLGDLIESFEKSGVWFVELEWDMIRLTPKVK
jgi:hypothetical protein